MLRRAQNADTTREGRRWYDLCSLLRSHMIAHPPSYVSIPLLSLTGMRGGKQKTFTHWLQMLEYGDPATHTPDATKPHKVPRPGACLRHRRQRLTPSLATPLVMCRSAASAPPLDISYMDAGQLPNVILETQARPRVNATAVMVMIPLTAVLAMTPLAVVQAMILLMVD